MKWLAESSQFHLFTNPSVINRFTFVHGLVISSPEPKAHKVSL